jgi:hypothetical protein
MEAWKRGWARRDLRISGGSAASGPQLQMSRLPSLPASMNL